MLPHTAKITSKGQLTLPKEVRDILLSDLVTFEIIDGKILVRPVVKVAGSLKNYRKNINFEAARSEAWNEVASGYQA
jgi:AbrB family looped-hinge helix DNA binding protein